MSAWPDDLKVAPIREWPGELTRNRARSLFKAGLTDSLQLIDREILHLTENRTQRESATMLVAIPAGDAWRMDGRPRAHAIAEHPGVIFSLDSKFGALSYPCDNFTTWQSNLRAIALALEALRKVDRYGVTKRGEQYRGFLAIEASAAPAGFASVQSAAEFLAELVGEELVTPIGPNFTRVLLRRSQMKSHPDRGGDVATFQRVSLAEAKLREAGLL